MAEGTQAGWYPDPEHAGQQRYWDGATWAEPGAAPTPSPSSTPAPPPQAYTSPKDARAQAKAAKAYAKAQRPFWKKKRYIIPVLLIALIVVISVASSSDTKKKEETAAKTCAGKTYPDQQKTDLCANAANTVSLGGLAVTAQPFVAKNDSIGGKALCSSITIKNTSDNSQDYNELDFKAQTPSGDVATLSTLNFAGTLNSGALIKGATKKGLVCTDNTGEKGQWVLIYKPNPFEATRGTWLFTV